MAIIRVKRGTTTPTTSQLSHLGEIAFDYSSNELFVRSSSQVVKVGGVGEQVYYYEGNVSSHQFNYTFNRDSIYRIHVISATNSRTADMSPTTFNYLTSTNSLLSGSYINVMYSDNYNGMARTSARSTSSFIINDPYTNSVAPRYAVTKVIAFELSPTFESGFNSTWQWVANGTSTCTGSDQANAPLTYTQFVHSIARTPAGMRIDPGLDLGTTSSIAVSIYRIKRR